jgi:hypothetical protein
MNNYADVKKNKRDVIERQVKEFQSQGGKIAKLEYGDSADFKAFQDELVERKQSKMREKIKRDLERNMKNKAH